MFLKVLNYGLRGLIILIGVLLVIGVFVPAGYDISFIRVMGVVFILFGIYRISMYHAQSNRYRREREHD